MGMSFKNNNENWMKLIDQVSAMSFTLYVHDTIKGLYSFAFPNPQTNLLYKELSPLSML